MARYIDADELYKATQKRIAEANEARMAVVDDEFLDLINDAFTEDVAPRAEWISARERLPEESGMYLVFTYRGNRTVLDYSERHKTFNSFDSFSTEEANEVAIAVTHWMPLPEPPKTD